MKDGKCHKKITAVTYKQWRSIISKPNARWHHVSRLKASAFCSLQKIMSINKTHQFIAGTGAAIYGVMEPHYNRTSHFAKIYVRPIEGSSEKIYKLIFL